ncbi:ras-related protein Rab-44 [Rhinatrema bivittatum]|uniref:ras-related protein Rab-44 n=1 Tax=Rhinatrema bivittatum TaxID=194408 RepID=UPI00112E6E51|nr:ras-related protein Rab-44 [Rhinatrema bivittatum]
MEEGQKASGKSRKLGSTRRIRRQQRDAEEAKPELAEEEDVMAKVQEFFQECDAEKKGFITRSDMQKVKGNFPCSSEELELLFDGLDTDRNGYVTTEELMEGIRTFVESQNIIKDQRRKRPSSKRISVVPRLPSLEETDNDERQHFLSFMDHLGANNIFEDESEIWKLWTKLRHEEPFLLGNLEEFLAKVTQEIKEARREKEALELTLKRRIANHNEVVKQLYEEMEEQLYQERERLRNESDVRSNIQRKEMRKALDIKDNEVQHLVLVQNELETQLHGLRSKQHVTSTENAQLKRTNQDLAEQLDGIRRQLLEAQERLVVMREEVSSEPRQEKRDQNLTEESREAPVTQDISHRDMPSQEEVVNLALGTEQKVESVLSSGGPDAIPHATPQDLSEVAVANSETRIRVISIEEDPLPEFLNEDPMELQNALSHPRILQMESLAEEAEMTERSGFPLPGTPSVHTGPGTQQSVRQTNVSEPEIQAAKQDAAHIDAVPQDSPPKDQNLQQLAVSAQEMARNRAPKEESTKVDVLVPDTEQPAAAAKVILPRDTPEAKLEEERIPEHKAPRVFTAENDSGRRRGLEDERRGAAPPKSNKVEGGSEQKAQDEGAEDHLAIRLEDALEEAEEQHRAGKPGDDVTDPSARARQSPDHVYKILFVGNSNVGKTSFLNQVHDGLYRRDMAATIGLDYRIKTLIVDNKSFALQLWDTAGQERYHSITKQFFRKADGVVVMYDVTCRPTFMAVRYWMDCVQEKAGDEVLTLLFGNKMDCDSERQVSTEEGKQLAEEHNLLFFECSAATGLNISESMTHLARSLKAHEDVLKRKVVNVRSQTEKKISCCM